MMSRVWRLSRSTSRGAVTSRSGRRSCTARSRSCRTRPILRSGMRNFMGYDRRWLDDPHLGDHVGRSVWALGDILSTAWVPAVVGPAGRLLDAIVGTLGGDISLRTGAYAALGLARLDSDRRTPAGLRLLERVADELAAAFEAHSSAGVALVRGCTQLRQRVPPSCADLRRGDARPTGSDGDGPRGAAVARRRVGPCRGNAAPDRPRWSPSR